MNSLKLGGTPKAAPRSPSAAARMPPVEAGLSPFPGRWPKARTPHFLALDGLRGFAAIVVVLLHICEYFELPVRPGHGYLAVDFFFMLSGFVVAHAYDDRLRSGMGVLAFMRVRLIRLYPLVALGVTIGTLALLARALMGHDISPGSVIAAGVTNALLLPSPWLVYLRPWAFMVNSPIWSLSYEIWVNGLFALCFPLFVNRVLVGVIFVGAVLLVLAGLFFGNLNFGYDWYYFYTGSVRVLFPFFTGILLLRATRSVTLRTSLGNFVWLPLIVLLAAPAFSGPYYDLAAVLFAFPVIVTVGAHASPSPRLRRLWTRMGELSFPLYALHFPFVVALSNIAHSRHWAGVQLWAAAAATFVVVIGIAWAGLMAYDIPARRFLNAWDRRRRAIA